MFVKSKLALAVSVLCFVQFPAVARDADAAKAELARTEDAIKAELAKPVGTPLASPSPAKAEEKGSNRFIERQGTGTSKAVRTAPAVVLPEGPLGKAPADMKKLIAEKQKEGGVALDTYQKDMNLPGLKRDDPSLKPFVLHTRNGVNEIVRMSGKLLNRIATPFSKPVVIDTSDSVSKVVGSDVYYMPAGEGPIGLYIADSNNTAQSIALTIIPAQDIPGQNLIVKLEDLRASENLALTATSPEEAEISQPRANDYTGYVRSLMTQAVRGKVASFAPVPLEGGVARIGPIEVTPEIAFTGSVVDVYRYSLMNKGQETVDLTETAFYRKGVKAVSFFPHLALKPGEGGYVFLLADKPKSASTGPGALQ